MGVAGLGRAFTIMLPTLANDPRIALVAAADPRADARARFAADFGARTYESVDELCKDRDVDVIYVATPHEHHAAHACLAASHAKHVLVEKPMAITLAECERMIEAARRAGTILIVGHSHSFNAPILRTRRMIESGAYGAVRMIAALNYTDFLYRPRRPEELDTAQGGGVIFSQAAHQIDIVRVLGGGIVNSVSAQTMMTDRARPTEGIYAALLRLGGEAVANVVYSGLGRFDSDEFTGWIGEMGARKDRSRYGAARKALRQADDARSEAALKNARNYGGAQDVSRGAAAATHHNHFGFVLVSCERADLRPQPDGVTIYDDDRVAFESVPVPAVPRAEVIDELYGAVVDGRPPLHDGEWGLATLEVCLAMLQSSREGREIALRHQVATRS